MFNQFVTPSQLGAFFWRCVNVRIINPGSQHFDLIGQQSKSHIVSWTKLLRQQHCEHLKNTQIFIHLSKRSIRQIRMRTNMLAGRICFRTPRKIKE